MNLFLIHQRFLGEVVVSHERIQSTVKRLAKDVFHSREYAGSTPILLCLKKGAIPFFKDLSKELTTLGFEFETAEMSSSSYNGTQSSGNVKVSGYRGPNLRGRVVIIVEDIIDSSNTIVKVCEYLSSQGVEESDIFICTLLFKEKPENTEWRNAGLNGFKQLPEVRHVGLFIKDLFVVGYGLDYEQYGRDGEDICVLTPESQAWVDLQIEIKGKKRAE